MIGNILKIILPALTSCIIGFIITPFISDFLYKHEFWKKKSVNKSFVGEAATISQKLHDDETRKIPRMGGIVVWGSLSITAGLFILIGIFAGRPDLNFISRSQTWLPFVLFIAGALVGLVDDYLVAKESGTYVGGGLSLSSRLLAVFAMSIVSGWWFTYKLGIVSIHIPFVGDWYVGGFLILICVILMIGTYAGGIIDGIDGLAGGMFAIMYSAFAIISFIGHQYDVAAFSMAVVGSLLTFLWFNIPPARFYLSETGTMALTIGLVAIAFLTKAIIVFLIISLPLSITVLSSVIQILSKKWRGKKVFVVAPLHNHFQAIGWPAAKVTMRYWIIGMFFALSGVIIALIG
jgi:phospho-N-acetylmuramoyl-pentapeptide-transferase